MKDAVHLAAVAAVALLTCSAASAGGFAPRGLETGTDAAVRDFLNARLARLQG